MTAHIDHIVIGAASLAAGVTWVAERLGVLVPPGGIHFRMGTHNRLMQLGPRCFFEIIAPDPAAPAPGRPRWFGLDHPPAVPRLLTWLAAVPDLNAAMAACPIDTGMAEPMERGSLQWRLSVPADGALIEGGTMPGLIEWPDPHPAAGMADLGCTLTRLTLGHPRPDGLRAALAAIGLIDPVIEIVEARGPTLSATIATPTGEHHL